MTLKLSCNWLDKDPSPSTDELEATLAAVRILIGSRNVTEYSNLVEGQRRSEDSVAQEKVHVPAYYLAEWVAENWWPLLHEPRKTEEGDDPSFRARHSILNAQHGFALPDVEFEPIGDAVQVRCRSRDAVLPGVRFPHSATTVMGRGPVEAVLRAFVQGCVDRLDGSGIAGTPLQQAWHSVSRSTQDEAEFCKLAGALGVDPYGISQELASVIDLAYDTLGPAATHDLCAASTPGEMLQISGIAKLVADELSDAHDTTLTPLANVRVPAESAHNPGWRRGKAAALSVRDALGIAHTDPNGCDRFFERLNVSTAPDGRAAGRNTPDEISFTAGVDRLGSTARIVLLPSHEAARRFAAPRSVFLALEAHGTSRRLATNAMTSDQKASRAFAAEMLVPSKYLEKRFPGRRLGMDDMHEIARERRADVSVVRYQAENNGLAVSRSL